MTRDAVPHGPTSPLSDEQPHPGTRGPSEPSGREIAAEGRAGGPTAGEIEAAARAIVWAQSNGCCNEWPRPCADCDCFRDQNPEMRASYEREHAAAALAAALPLIEARLREQIAGEIDAEYAKVAADEGATLTEDRVIDAICNGLLRAARIARGRT